MIFSGVMGALESMAVEKSRFSTSLAHLSHLCEPLLKPLLTARSRAAAPVRWTNP